MGGVEKRRHTKPEMRRQMAAGIIPDGTAPVTERGTRMKTFRERLLKGT